MINNKNLTVLVVIPKISNINFVGRCASSFAYHLAKCTRRVWKTYDIRYCFVKGKIFSVKEFSERKKSTKGECPSRSTC